MPGQGRAPEIGSEPIATDPGQDARVIPQAFVDAGDRAWKDLEPVVRRSLAGLLPGDVLEVATGDEQAIEALPTWCSVQGVALIHLEPGDGIVTFWIGKG